MTTVGQIRPVSLFEGVSFATATIPHRSGTRAERVTKGVSGRLREYSAPQWRPACEDPHRCFANLYACLAGSLQSRLGSNEC